jgi:hypothetical protein
MTLSTRRFWLSLLRLPVLAALATTGLGWYFWSRGVLPSIVPGTVITMVWWEISRSAAVSDTFWAFIGLTWFALFPAAAELIIGFRFRRSPSPEIFFFRLFLLSLPWQCTRFALIFSSGGLIDPSWALPLARIALFGRFAGLAVLINIALFGSGLPFQRSGAVLGMGALAAFALSVLMPLDITQPLGNLVFRSGGGAAPAILTISLGILATAAMVGSVKLRERKQTAVLTAALFFLVAGTDMAVFVTPPLLVPGMALILIGTVALTRQLRSIYQWI